jgi:hypothetical protein
MSYNPNGSSDACIIPDVPDTGPRTVYDRALRAMPDMSRLA